MSDERSLKDRIDAARPRLTLTHDDQIRRLGEGQADVVSALRGCLDALKSIPPRMRSGDMERQIRRAEKALGK